MADGSWVRRRAAGASRVRSYDIVEGRTYDGRKVRMFCAVGLFVRRVSATRLERRLYAMPVVKIPAEPIVIVGEPAGRRSDRQAFGPGQPAGDGRW